MPSPNPGVWVEYEEASSENEWTPEILRTFSAQIDALKAAVKDRADVTFLTHGRTIAEQLEIDRNPEVAALEASSEPRRRTRKPKSENVVDGVMPVSD